MTKITEISSPFFLMKGRGQFHVYLTHLQSTNVNHGTFFADILGQLYCADFIKRFGTDCAQQPLGDLMKTDL